MIAALLLAVVPTAPISAALPVPGAPCVCFPLQHEGQVAMPDKALAKAGWKPDQLVDETLKIVRANHDVFVRAEALRSTLTALGHPADAKSKEGEAVAAAQSRLFEMLSADLKRETELAPYPHAVIEIERYVDETRARIAALPGVVRVERSHHERALNVWFDEKVTGARSFDGCVPGSKPRIVPATQAPRAAAAITLAFAGQASNQMGRRVDFDAPALAREAAELQPKDPRVLLLAAMVWADSGSSTGAALARDAARNAKDDEYARKNIIAILGAFYGAGSLEELDAKLAKKTQRG
jgi:hypothetical protein